MSSLRFVHWLQFTNFQIYSHQQEMSNLEIQFGTSLTFRHAFAAFSLSALIFFSAFLGTYLHDSFGAMEKSILQSRNVSVTEGPNIFFCDLPYNQCLCSSTTNKLNALDDCITYAQLVTSRISPLISFLGQMYLIWKLFSLNGVQSRLIVYSLWIISVFFLSE